MASESVSLELPVIDDPTLRLKQFTEYFHAVNMANRFSSEQLILRLVKGISINASLQLCVELTSEIIENIFQCHLPIKTILRLASAKLKYTIHLNRVYSIDVFIKIVDAINAAAASQVHQYCRILIQVFAEWMAREHIIQSIHKLYIEQYRINIDEDVQRFIHLHETNKTVTITDMLCILQLDMVETYAPLYNFLWLLSESVKETCDRWLLLSPQFIRDYLVAKKSISVEDFYRGRIHNKGYKKDVDYRHISRSYLMQCGNINDTAGSDKIMIIDFIYKEALEEISTSSDTTSFYAVTLDCFHNLCMENNANIRRFYTNISYINRVLIKYQASIAQLARMKADRDHMLHELSTSSELYKFKMTIKNKYIIGIVTLNTNDEAHTHLIAYSKKNKLKQYLINIRKKYTNAELIWQTDDTSNGIAYRDITTWLSNVQPAIKDDLLIDNNFIRLSYKYNYTWLKDKINDIISIRTRFG